MTKDHAARNAEASTDAKIWQVVTAIPPGCVATYGEVAARAGMPGAGRRVGRALKFLPAGTKVPWHRVVNAAGRLSLPLGSAAHQTQMDRLQAEGVSFRPSGSIDLKRFRW